MANHNNFFMPARGERAAPTFDQNKPRELLRFFEDLEYLFARASLEDEAEKKKHALRYVTFEVEQIWKNFSEYTDPLKTYKDFKAAILLYYPDVAGDYAYSMNDMDRLIGERQRIGMSTTDDLSDYHIKFLSITNWLMDRKQLSLLEQERNYIRAFQPRLMAAINNRLQMKDQDRHPNIPYEVKDVYEAARFILQGAAVAPQNFFAPTPPGVNPPFVPDNAVGIAKREPVVKQEDLGSLLAAFSKSIIEAINLNQNQRSRTAYTNTTAGSGRQTDCNFCGGPHYIRECEKVEEFIKEGKCIRNADGKVVLPNGQFVPREIPGTVLSERIEEWHRRNPNQRCVVTLFHAQKTNVISASIGTETATKPQFQLSTSDRIATIEAELFNLRARKVGPAARTRSQKGKVAFSDDVEEIDAPAVKEARQQARIEEVPDIDAPKALPPKDKPVVSEPIAEAQQVVEPEHPYQNAKDAIYAPPSMRNVGAPIKSIVAAKKNEPAYKTLPPVHDPAVATEVYKRSMDTPITITQRELLSLSPEVRSQVRDITTTRRIPNNSTVSQVALQLEEDSNAFMEEELENTSVDALHLKRNCKYPPNGAIVVSDPVERYYRSLPPGQSPDPDRLIVAKDSSAVRSLLAIIDASEKTECILDPGCQIVAMSEQLCHSLCLAYDPSIKLNMISANGTTDWSLGLARNVPFTIGSMTLYMQTHIIRSPAYDVLLGRPFDILTESIIRNFSNEDQTITISDPNTGQRYTIPTFPRGKHYTRHIGAGEDFY